MKGLLFLLRWVWDYVGTLAWCYFWFVKLTWGNWLERDQAIWHAFDVKHFHTLVAVRLWVVGLIVIFVISQWLKYQIEHYGEALDRPQGTHRRGAWLTSERTLARSLKRRRKWREAKLQLSPTLFLPASLECQGIFLIGAPGTGKTVSINYLLDSFRKRHIKAVVLDAKGGEFVAERFGEDRNDVILNPFDARASCGIVVRFFRVRSPKKVKTWRRYHEKV